MTLEPFYLYTDKGCNSEDACRRANELVHEPTQKQEMIWAAVRRTLMTWRQPSAHHREKKRQNFIRTHGLIQTSCFGSDLHSKNMLKNCGVTRAKHCNVIST